MRGGLDRSPHGETSEALFLNSGFVYDEPETAERRFAGEDDGYVYGRYGNPTVTMFEERLRLLEGAEACYALAPAWRRSSARSPASSRPAITRVVQGAVRLLLSDRHQHPAALRHRHDACRRQGYGGAGSEAITAKTKCVFLETPSNPTLEVIDLRGGLRDRAKSAAPAIVVDNIFATPILQKPLDYGADVVVYSGTKHIDGQGRVLGGAILSTRKFKEELLKPFLRHTGPSISPFNAWVLLKGMETLKLRVIEQSRAAAGDRRAQSQAMPGVTRVHLSPSRQPSAGQLCRAQMAAGGTMVTFEVEGGKTQAFDVLRQLELIEFPTISAMPNR